MGGALILLSIAFTTLLWGDLENRFMWIVLLVMLAFGAIGWIDDYRKVVQRNPKGLSAAAKFFWQSLIGIVAGAYSGASLGEPTAQRIELLGVSKELAHTLGIAIVIGLAAGDRPGESLLSVKAVARREDDVSGFVSM